MRLSPQLLIATANAFSGVRGALPSELVELFRRQVELEHRACWDAAIVYHWGYWSHYDHRGERSFWPFPPLRTSDDIARFTRQRGLIEEKPEVGDLFLLYSPVRRAFVRTGVVAQVFARGWYDPRTPYFDVLSLEGDTDTCGDLGGGEVRRVLRRLSVSRGDRFVRWVGYAA
jgi:hypothetical protein